MPWNGSQGVSRVCAPGPVCPGLGTGGFLELGGCSRLCSNTGTAGLGLLKTPFSEASCSLLPIWALLPGRPHTVLTQAYTPHTFTECLLYEGLIHYTCDGPLSHVAAPRHEQPRGQGGNIPPDPIPILQPHPPIPPPTPRSTEYPAWNLRPGEGRLWAATWATGF